MWLFKASSTGSFFDIFEQINKYFDEAKVKVKWNKIFSNRNRIEFIWKMRRRAGIGAVHKQKLEAEKFKDKGTELQESQFEQMTKQMEIFRENLEEFATKHRNEIKKNAQFRRQFQEMCAAIGVDPLASGKGFWSVLGMGDFYYELGVQVVEVCLASNHATGGLMELDELRTRLIAARGQNSSHQEITKDDILIAAKKLKIFGNG